MALSCSCPRAGGVAQQPPRMGLRALVGERPPAFFPEGTTREFFPWRFGVATLSQASLSLMSLEGLWLSDRSRPSKAGGGESERLMFMGSTTALPELIFTMVPCSANPTLGLAADGVSSALLPSTSAASFSAASAPAKARVRRSRKQRASGCSGVGAAGDTASSPPSTTIKASNSACERPLASVGLAGLLASGREASAKARASAAPRKA
mmetsp:Transcript_140035/g.447849  ORF Transcript_140035/g.447849 Transcript_140035/m.447849 type:complete len:209 (+) Transcript_140035:379-1005(+)